MLNLSNIKDTFFECGPLTRARSLCIHALFKLIDASGMSARCAGSPGICRPKDPFPTPSNIPLSSQHPCVQRCNWKSVNCLGWPARAASSSLRRAIDGRQKWTMSFN